MAKGKANSSFAIGQIIYILSNEGQSVLPAIVVEKTTVQTLQGDKVSWKLAVGSGPKQKVVDSTRIKGEIFESLDDIRALLSKRLKKFINDVIRQAQAREQQWYGTLKGKRKETQQGADEDQGKIDPETLISDLDNVNMPPPDVPQVTNPAEFANYNEQLSENEQKAEVQKKLRQLATMPEEDEEGGGGGAESNFTMTTPDGEKVSVNLKA